MLVLGIIIGILLGGLLGVILTAFISVNREETIFKKRNKEAIDKIQHIIDYGFDYDDLNTAESLKGLIDMLVDYARQSKDILEGSDN